MVLADPTHMHVTCTTIAFMVLGLISGQLTSQHSCQCPVDLIYAHTQTHAFTHIHTRAHTHMRASRTMVKFMVLGLISGQLTSQHSCQWPVDLTYARTHTHTHSHARTHTYACITYHDGVYGIGPHQWPTDLTTRMPVAC